VFSCECGTDLPSKESDHLDKIAGTLHLKNRIAVPRRMRWIKRKKEKEREKK
jgi:hypothetical protein